MPLHLAQKSEATSRPDKMMLVMGSRADRTLIESAFVHESFKLFSIGPGTAYKIPDPRQPRSNDELENLFASLKTEIGDGHWIHPGCTRWASRVDFVSIASQNGFVPLTSPIRSLAICANKFNFLMESERLRIPNLLLNYAPLLSRNEILKNAPLTYPFVIRAVWGGMDHPFIVIYEPADLEENLSLWLSQIRTETGGVLFFIEKYLDAAKLIEAPFARFSSGEFESLPFIDHSLSKGIRRLIDFIPAQGLRPDVCQRIREFSAKLAQHCGIVGVGSFTFLVEDGQAFLSDVTPHLAPQHLLIPKVSGQRPLQMQLSTFFGKRNSELREIETVRNRHVAFARVLSEDPVLDLPRCGVLRELEAPSAHAAESQFIPDALKGETIETWSSGLVGYCIGVGKSYDESLIQAEDQLEKTWVSGTLNTNLDFVLQVIGHPFVRSGLFHASFLEEEFVPDLDINPDHVEFLSSLLQRVGAVKPSERWKFGPFSITLSRDPETEPSSDTQAPALVTTNENGISCTGTIRASDQRAIRYSLHFLCEDQWQVRLGTKEFTFRAIRKEKPRELVTLRSLCSGQLYSILAAPGGELEPRTPILLVYAIQRMVSHTISNRAIVESFHVSPEAEVTYGQSLASLRIIGRNAQTQSSHIDSG